MGVCLGSVHGSDIAGVRRPLLISRGPRVRSNNNYQTLPSQRRLVDEFTQSPKPAATHCADRRRVMAHAVAVDLGATGNSYGGRSSSDDDNGNCDRRRELLYAVSDVDLTSCVDHHESATRKHYSPSSTDLPYTTDGLTMATDGLDQCTAMFGGLLHGGLSLQALPDTHL